MRTYFYDRTAYKLSDEPVPNCFFLLDDHFNRCFPNAQAAYTSRSVWLAESVCSRMADVEMYAFLIADANRRHPDDIYTTPTSDTSPTELSDDGLNVDAIHTGKAPILTRSFLMGYLTSCRALLDSGALTLGMLHNLDLPIVQQRFSNTEFWRQLVSVVPNVHRRYHSMRLFFRDVAHWCDEISLRLPPVVALYAEDGLGRMITNEMQTHVLDEPMAKLDDVPLGLDHNWLEPMALHRRWKPNLLSLCERLCQDIESQTRGLPPEFGQ